MEEGDANFSCAEEFDFLGYTFRPRKVRTKTGYMRLGFLPAISKKATEKIRKEFQISGNRANCNFLAGWLTDNFKNHLQVGSRITSLTLCNYPTEVFKQTCARWL